MKPEDGPWVSLPSKHYPDKVYYFNVSSGVSSWEKPEHYCEPVDDSTTFQCLTKPTTPERTENRSYIVESLSPASSPRKPKDVSKPAQDVCEQKDNEDKAKKDTFHIQRDRSNVQNHPYTKDTRRMQLNNEFNERISKERNLKISYYPTPRPLKQVMKGERSSCMTTFSDRSECPETVLQNMHMTSQKYLCSENVGKLSYGETSNYRHYRSSQNLCSFKDRSYLSFTRDKLSNASTIYGAASLRLENLKRKLAEEHDKKEQLSLPDWAENSRDREWQTRLVKQRNNLDCGSRLSGIPLHASASSDSRKDRYFSDSKRHFFESGDVGIVAKTSASGLMSDNSEHLRLSELRKKSCFSKDSFDSSDSSTLVLPKTNYIHSVSETIASNSLKLQSYQTRPYSRLNSEEYSRSSDFSGNRSTNICFSGYVSKTSANGLAEKYNRALPDVKHKTDVGKINLLSQSDRNSIFKPDLLSPVSKMQAIEQYPGRQKMLQDETYQKTDFIKDNIQLPESRKDSLSSSEFPRKLKLPSIEQLRYYKLMLLQAKSLQKEHSGHYSYLPKSSSSGFSKLRPFPPLPNNSSLGLDTNSLLLSELNNKRNTEEYFLSGNMCNLDSSKKSRTDTEHEINQRKPIHNRVDNKIPSSFSKSSRVYDKDIGTSCESNKTNSWKWNPPGLVRDYNHKRIADCDEATHTFAYDNITHEKSIANNYIKVELKEKQAKEKANEPRAVQQNCIATKLELSCKYSKYEHPVRPSDHKNMLCGSRRKTEESLKQKNYTLDQTFGNGQKKHSSGQRHSGEASSPKSDKYLENINTCVNFATNIKSRCQSGEQCSPSVLKRKSHESKGGITKINRKVQKQLRNVVPKLINLSSGSIEKKRSALKNDKTSDPCCGSGTQITGEEEMDWEPIEPEKVVLHVEALRREGGLQNTVNSELVNLCSASTPMSSEWFIVLDTNVLLSHLGLLNELLKIKDNELGMPTLFVPWIALQELDNLKSTNKKPALQHHARKAVNFLFENLLCRHPRVKGQPKCEADEHYALEPDDSILQCSINLQKHSNKVLLLTNDRNLFNKSIVSGVECCSAAKLVEELEKRRKPSLNPGSLSSTSAECNETKRPYYSVVDDAKQCVGIVLEEVLRTEMVLAYDRKWTEIVARKPPWTLNDILFCVLKHWTAVFHLVLPSAARELIEKIRLFINNEAYESSLKTVENLLKTCVSLMHLVSSLCYKKYVDDALNTLHRLQHNLKNQESSSVMDVLPSSCLAASTRSTTSKVDDTSTVSGHARSTTSDSTSDPSTKSEQQTKTVSSISGSGGICSHHGSSIRGRRKVDSEDDCLSLFASSFSEDVNHQSSDTSNERGKELSHIYLNKIWEKVAVYCGMLCDTMGMDSCVPYQRPEPFPTVEVLHQNMLYFVKCVNSLLHCIEGILTIQPCELYLNSPLLLNLYATIKESLSLWNGPGETLLPQHVLVYCTDSDTRQQLECGKKQFQQFENILNQAMKFFMAQNQTSGSLPSF